MRSTNKIAIVVALWGAAGFAIAGAASLRNGTLTVRGNDTESRLYLNGQQVKGVTGEGPPLIVKRVFSVSDSDVVLIEAATGGTACAAYYYFVTVPLSGTASVTREFGTCSDKGVAAQEGMKIKLSMPKPGGKGRVEYTYKDGNLSAYNGGKPMLIDNDSLFPVKY